jgi:hypothetical protein
LTFDGSAFIVTHPTPHAELDTGQDRPNQVSVLQTFTKLVPVEIVRR